MLKFLRSHAAVMTVSGAAAIIAVLLCYISQPRFLRLLEYKIYDALTASRAGPPRTEVPVIIDIDEASLERYGQWPWPRVLLADLLQKLHDAGVAATGVDILLSEADRSSPAAIQESLGALSGVELDLSGLPEHLRDYDRVFAEALNAQTVLGMHLQYGSAPEPAAGESRPAGVNIIVRKSRDARQWDEAVPLANKVTLPLALFRQKAPVGLLDINPDDDGVVRRLPVIGRYGDAVHATLSLRTLMAALGRNELVIGAGPDGLESVRAGNFSIPLLPDGAAMPLLRSRAGSFTYHSARDVLQGEIPPESLAGRIAFIGTSVPGLLDIRSTPLERAIPGVEIHAAMLDSILSGNFLHVPAWMPGAQALAIILCGIAASLAFALSRPKVYILAGAFLFGAAVYGSLHLFRKGIFASPLYVAAVILLCGGIILVLRFLHEEKQKKILRGAFSRYVSPEVVERIAKLEGDIFGGEERELTIIFTDIRGFTSISEKLSPQDIVSLLNRYFTPMTNLVRSSKGTLDKFIGDALMAFWNAPLDVPGHAALGLSTALAMQETLKTINPGIEKDFGVTLAMGAGVHTGKAYVGNMGSDELLNYTLIGDNVNLASRLEGLCSAFGVGIVTSAETMEQALATPEGASLTFQPLDTLRVKGKKQPVSVFTVMSAEEGAARRNELELHEAAFTAYREGNFTLAARGFAESARIRPDNRMYAVLLARLEQLAASPPKDWDGVWTMTGK